MLLTFVWRWSWCCSYFIWAPSSEFVSLSIPSWQILTAHAQPFRGARDLAFCLKVPLDSLLVWASSGGSGETARMRRLAWTFAARIGDKYQIRLTRPIWFYGFYYEAIHVECYLAHCWTYICMCVCFFSLNSIVATSLGEGRASRRIVNLSCMHIFLSFFSSSW